MARTQLSFSTNEPPNLVTVDQVNTLVQQAVENLPTGNGDMMKSQNLAGLTNIATARENLGLGNVDNTSDVNKPVSTAQATAIAAAENNAKNASRAVNWVPTWAEVSGKPATFAPSVHGHDWTEIANKPGFFSGSYTDLTNKPASFTPSAHNHAIGDVTNLTTELANKQGVNTELSALLAALVTGTGYPHRTGVATYVIDTPAGGGGASGTKTIAWFDASRFQPTGTNYATFDTRNNILVLDFDDTAAESVFALGVVPEGLSVAGVKVRLFWAATTAVTGNVKWVVSVEKFGTTLDTDSYDTATSAVGTVSGTTGIETVTEITLTAWADLVAGDRFRVLITRDSADTANDTLVGDVELVGVEVRAV